MSLHQSVIRV
ncbi:hypothetical protein YPPY60_0504, partial [Yersinia pestis PY-60]